MISIKNNQLPTIRDLSIVIMFLSCISCNNKCIVGKNNRYIQSGEVSGLSDSNATGVVIKLDWKPEMRRLLQMRSDRARMYFQNQLGLSAELKSFCDFCTSESFHLLIGGNQNGSTVIIAGYGSSGVFNFNQGMILFPSIVVVNDRIVINDNPDKRRGDVRVPGGQYASVVTVFPDMLQLGVFEASCVLSNGRKQVIMKHIQGKCQSIVFAKHSEGKPNVFVKWQGAKRKPAGSLGKWVWLCDGNNIVMEIELMPDGRMNISKVTEYGKSIGFEVYLSESKMANRPNRDKYIR